MPTLSSDPFASPGPAEVSLPRSPLARVIAQVLFPPVASLARIEFIGPFQEEIRARYPSLQPVQLAGFALGPAGMAATLGGGAWRFADKANAWSVSLAPHFVALETTAYSDRDEFLDQFAQVLAALHTTAGPATSERLGVRYINRIRAPELELLPALVRPEVLGIAATSFAAPLKHSICESMFDAGHGQLSTRWGLLPANATTDPTALEPIGEICWLLDLDMHRQGSRDFDPQAVLAESRTFTKTIHDFFRWCVTDEMLRVYGGNP